MTVGNHHFGNIGDVWKHLVWSEIVDDASWDRIWETHAGAAEYDLTPNSERRYGIYHYLENAVTDGTLESAAYSRVLRRVADADTGAVERYPGSPLQAMTLSNDDTEFLFCDVQQGCLESIEERAREYAPDATVDCANDDGIATVFDALEATDSVAGTAIHIDPFETFSDSETCGRSPIDLFRTAVDRGATTVLWYGFESLADRDQRFGRLRREIDERFDATDDLWCGGVGFDVPDDVDVGAGPNLVGCHMLCGNLRPALRERCRTLGEALADRYAADSLPATTYGSLEYREFFE